MTEERVNPLRERMIEDMRIRSMGEKAQKVHIQASVKHTRPRSGLVSRPRFSSAAMVR